MKKILNLTFAAAVVMAVASLTGCQKEEDASAPAAAEEKMDAAEHAAEHPAEQKPKDHPAH